MAYTLTVGSPCQVRCASARGFEDVAAFLTAFCLRVDLLARGFLTAAFLLEDFLAGVLLVLALAAFLATAVFLLTSLPPGRGFTTAGWLVGAATCRGRATSCSSQKLVPVHWMRPQPLRMHGRPGGRPPCERLRSDDGIASCFVRGCASGGSGVRRAGTPWFAPMTVVDFLRFTLPRCPWAWLPEAHGRHISCSARGRFVQPTQAQRRRTWLSIAMREPYQRTRKTSAGRANRCALP